MSNKRYSVNQDNIYNLDFELIYISEATYGEDWHSTTHIHPFSELFFITNGQGYFQVDNKIVPVKEGDLIIINPNCPHTEKSLDSSKPLKYIVFGINNLTLGDGMSNITDSPEDALNLYRILSFDSNKHEILYYLNTLIREVELKDTNYELACKSLLNLFLIYIIRKTKTNFFISEKTKKVNIECIKMKNHIDSHYSENITLDSLAALFHLNKFHLSHLFTKQIGMSPINYLINKRIEESKNLLINTNHSIIEICTMVGFSNSSYFSQMFKKIVGSSPKTFRALNLQQNNTSNQKFN